MVSPHTPTSTNSSALFGSDDTSFLEALVDAVLPGDLITQAGNGEEIAQKPSVTSSPNEASSSGLEPPPCAQPAWSARTGIRSGDELEHDTRIVNPSSNVQFLSKILTLAKMTNCLCHNSSLPLRLSQDIRSAHTLYPVMMNIQNRRIPQPTLQTEALAHIWILIPTELRDSVVLANICVESAQNCKYKMRRWEAIP